MVNALVGAKCAMPILPAVGYFPMTHVEFHPTAFSLNPTPYKGRCQKKNGIMWEKFPNWGGV